MEPRIQYAKTRDGVSIALWTMGQGTPFVHMPAPLVAVLQAIWQSSNVRRYFERYAETRLLIRYDSRGFGHSQRDVAGFSLDAWEADLSAVVDHLGLEGFALFGSGTSVPIALAYAASHPGRTTHLILWNGSARGRDLINLERNRALLALADADWEFYTEAVAQASAGWSGGEDARRVAAGVREGQTPQALRATMEAVLQVDVSDLLSDVACPTLVIHGRGHDLPEINVSRRLVGLIPNAQLAVIEGRLPYADERDPFFRIVDDFLGNAPGKRASAVEAGLVTILFTDLTTSTALTQRLGDAKAQELVRAHNAIVREALAAHGGSEIKHTGDGIMASFGTASGALECAVALQRRFAAFNEEQGTRNQEPGPAAPPLLVHVGLNAGEPVAEESDLYGTAVQLARRICDAAEGGEILVSNVVRELAAGKGFLFADRGETALRGFEDPVRLYEVRWRESD